MNAATKLSAYSAVLALVFGGGWAVGTAVGPLSGAGPASMGAHDGMAGGQCAGHGDNHSGAVVEEAPTAQPGGPASSRGGYTLTPLDTTLTPGAAEQFAFRITGPDGSTVRQFDIEHDKRMHVIVVRRDTTGFQHVHPEMGPDGTWRLQLTLPAAGPYRAFADFVPAGGEATTLGVDLAAPGPFTPAEHQPSRTAQVDGYQVRLDGDLVSGQSSPLTLTVSQDGRPVTDLQPYLAAYGHLVALRECDLAYLHVHPDGEPGDGRTRPGPQIVFHAEAPSAGDYRLFLDFQHGGQVRTAAFTVAAQDGTPQQQSPPPAHSGHGGHG
ncbi:MAG: hypothetical protein ACRDSL_12835 [Pseudonocardiaceae bacterium]